MISGHRRPLLVAALAAAATLAGAAASQTTESRLRDPPSTAAFLTPLPAPAVLQPGDRHYPRRFCRDTIRRPCPPVLWYGGVDGFPTVDPAFSQNLPNVRVTFLLESVSHEIVAEGGVSDPNLWVSTTSPTAQQEIGSYELPLPAAGETLDLQGTNAVIYDALVFDACGSFPPFPVDHVAAVVNDDPDLLGSFHGSDDSTLDSTGFYSFSYTIRAKFPGTSDFHVAGKASVTCSGLAALP